VSDVSFAGRTSDRNRPRKEPSNGRRVRAHGSQGRQLGEQIEGDDGALPGVHSTKQVAVAAGRAEAVARNTEHVIHNEDGSIGERNSYGGDPAHRPG
jgi:hypothetical protein